jgi:hypothetical protein
MWSSNLLSAQIHQQVIMQGRTNLPSTKEEEILGQKEVQQKQYKLRQELHFA